MNLQIPALLSHQVPWRDLPQRFKLLRCGRRAGKDVFSLHAAVVGHGPPDCPGPPWCPRSPHPATEPCFRGLAHGLDVAWIAPTNPQALILWETEIVPRFKGKVPVNEVERTVTIGAATLWVRSAEAIESVRGLGKRIAGVVVNEAAHMDLEYAWRSVIRPILMDNRGWAVIGSTTNCGSDGYRDPDTGNLRTPSYFNVLCQEVQDGKRDPLEWVCVHATAEQNPKIAPSELASLIGEYPQGSVALQQEVYAELLTSAAGRAFPEFRPDLHVLREFHVPPNWRWAACLDWGYRRGYFAVCALGPDGDIVLVWEKVLQGLSADQAGQACGLGSARFPIEYIAVDSAMQANIGMGETLLEQFQRGFDRGAPRPWPVSIVPSVKGPHSIAAGTQVLHRYLAYRVAKDGKVPDWGRPHLRMTQECPELASVLKSLALDPRHPDAYDTTGNDHAADAIRYLLGSRPPLADPWPAGFDPDSHPGFDESYRRKRPYEVSLTQHDAQHASAQPEYVRQGPLTEAGW